MRSSRASSRRTARWDAVRRALWTIAAKTIDVRKLDLADGDTIDLVVREGERTLTIDGVPSTAEIPQLAENGDYAAHAERLDGDLWEIQVEAL